MASWLLESEPICLADLGSAQLAWARLGQGVLQASACREVVLAAGGDADGGHGAERETSLEQVVQGGEGSAKQPVPLLVKQVGFFSREASPGESPAGLGWGMKQGSYQDKSQGRSDGLGYKIWVQNWAIKLLYITGLPKLGYHNCTGVFPGLRRCLSTPCGRMLRTVSSMRGCGNG